MVQGKNAVPRIAYELPLLQSLIELGGSVKPDDKLYHLVAKKMGFNDSDTEYDLVHAREKWVYTLQWVRYNLVQQGDIDGSKRGVWTVTEAGRQRATHIISCLLKVEHNAEVASPMLMHTVTQETSLTEKVTNMLLRYHQLRVDLAASADLSDLLTAVDPIAFWMSGELDARSLVASALNCYLAPLDAEVATELSVTEDDPMLSQIVASCRNIPVQARSEHMAELSRLINLFHHEFLNKFSTIDGDIDWEKLVAFSSGRDKPKRTRFARETSEDEYQPTLD